MQNVERASHAVQTLAGRTEDARYYLIRGDIYRAAWQLARQQKLAAKADIAGVSDAQSSHIWELPPKKAISNISCVPISPTIERELSVTNLRSLPGVSGNGANIE